MELTPETLTAHPMEQMELAPETLTAHPMRQIALTVPIMEVPIIQMGHLTIVDPTAILTPLTFLFPLKFIITLIVSL
jgi:hypothetical protein